MPKIPLDTGSLRPTVMGRHYAVSSGHYLATEAAMRVLARGGNATDAGVTASLALAVLQPDIVSFAGVAPTLIYDAGAAEVISIAGLGYWPRSTDISVLVKAGGESVPEGVLRTVIPAAPAAHLAALSHHGSLSFEQVATPALQLARDGFAMYPFLAKNIETHADQYDRYSENARVFRPGGHTPTPGTIFRQRDLAVTIEQLIAAERTAHGDRQKKLQAVHDCFYRGSIARAIADYHARHGGFLTREDLADFTVPLEKSIHVRYRDFELHCCDVWCQGISFLEALKIAETLGIGRFDHNSAAYVHHLSQALNLAFSDREAYVGDPRFISVPTAGLLSESYAAMQCERIDPTRAFASMPPQGDPPGSVKRPTIPTDPGSDGTPLAPDTIYCAVIDSDGNAYSATLSDTSFDTPIIPGTGLAISSRGSQSRLHASHSNAVRPGKRPRLTPTPALAVAGNRPYLAFGTPGGDVQCQTMLQLWLNIVEFGLPVQTAVEAARFATYNFPGSFAPHTYLPGRLCLEARFSEDVFRALGELGHDVERWPLFTPAAGGACAVLRHPENGILHAGADPRREAYAAAW